MSDTRTRRDFLVASTSALVGSSLAGGLYAAPKKDNDWIELFDGKTLKGWHKNPERIGHGTGGIWRAEDGAITGEQDPPGSGNGGIVLTDRKFGNFELLIDMKPDWGVCSGLFLRSNDKGQCLQMMVDYHDAGNVGHLYGEGTGGFNTRTFDIDGIYKGEDKKLVGIKTSKHKAAKEVGLISSCTPEEWVKAWKLNDWNTAKVRITGDNPKITTWINGQRVCEFDGATSSNEKYQADKKKILDTIGTEGSIAVQVHGGKGWPKGSKCRWKNIRIKSL
ncbi:MAG: DUF1080 domain-containing protein [Planctomycetes bacterium]|nr:DUF1080 domain-containing protein [Planctomycetota bacterium]